LIYCIKLEMAFGGEKYARNMQELRWNLIKNVLVNFQIVELKKRIAAHGFYVMAVNKLSY